MLIELLVVETYIEQEAIRLLSLAIDAAVGQLLQEQNPLANSELEIVSNSNY